MPLPVPLSPDEQERRRQEQLAAGVGSHPNSGRGGHPPRPPRKLSLKARIQRRAQRSVSRRLREVERIVDSPLEETRDRIRAFGELVKIAQLAGQNVDHTLKQDRPFEIRATVGPERLPSKPAEPEIEGEVEVDEPPRARVILSENGDGSE